MGDPVRKPFVILIVVGLFLLFIKRNNMTWRQSFLKTFYPLVMLPGKIFGTQKIMLQNTAQLKPITSFYELTATGNHGEPINFSQFRGKKVLIVNTASDCGYTGQYAELESLYQQHKDKLVVIAFPANDFKQQEQRNDEAIAEFCKVNYGVSFPLMKKSSVVPGTQQDPVFQWLTKASLNGWCNQTPLWNFNKYLVNEHGVLQGFFPSSESPLGKEISGAIN